MSQFSNILADSVFEGVAVVLPRLDIHVIEDLMRFCQYPVFSWFRALLYRGMAGSASLLGARDVHHEAVPGFVTGKSDFFDM